MTRFKPMTSLATSRPRGHPREKRPARLLARWAGALGAAIAFMLLLGPGIASAAPTPIRIYGGSMCLDDPGGSTAWGQPLQIWRCYAGDANQLWSRLPEGADRWGNNMYIYANAASRLCLDVYQDNAEPGTRAIQWPCNANDEAQRMRDLSPPAGMAGQRIQNGLGAPWWWGSGSGTGNCLDNWYNINRNGNPVDFYGCNSTPAQDWQIN
jgi:hypothetical protein